MVGVRLFHSEMMRSLLNFHKNIVLDVSLTSKRPPYNRRFFSAVSSARSWLSIQGNPLIKWPPNPDVAPPQSVQQNPFPTPKENPDYLQNDFFAICNILKDPSIQPGPSLQTALDRTGIEPELGLLQAVFDHFDSSPKLLHSVFLWAEKKPGFQSSAAMFNSMVNLLGKEREFDSAWCLVLDKISGDNELGLISRDTFSILIRRYTRAGKEEFFVILVVLWTLNTEMRIQFGTSLLFSVEIDNFYLLV